MTHVRALTAGLIVTLVAAATATSTNVSAQTTAPGAYYAPPAWSQTLPGSTRFIVLSNFNSEAVLDRETGLVWERSPSTEEVTWERALFECAGRSIASRKAWRMPTFSELQSLVDTSQIPVLSQNHPFTNVFVDTDFFLHFYWSQTPLPSSPGWYLIAGFRSGSFGASPGTGDFRKHVWCVRGQGGAQ